MELTATWQRHAGPRGTYAAYIFINILHIIYCRGFWLSVDQKGIQTIRSSDLINPTVLLNFFRVGLSSTQLSSFQATWLTEEHRSGGALKIHASIT